MNTAKQPTMLLTDATIKTLPGANIILKSKKLRNFLQKGLQKGNLQSEALVDLLESLNITEEDEAEVFGAVDALGVPVLNREDNAAPEPIEESKGDAKHHEPAASEDSLVIFLGEVGAYDIPTREQVTEMCQRMNAGKIAQATLDAAQSNGEVLDRTRLRELKRAIRLGKEAKDDLIQGNLRLVVSIARKMYHNTSSMDLQDLIQEGNLGLMKAADRFDYNRGVLFSTYATWWVRQSIGRALAEKDRHIRIPVYMTDIMTKLNTIKRGADRDLTEEELAIALSGGDEAWAALSEKGRQRFIKKVQEVNRLELTSKPLSMDFPRNEEPDADPFGAFVPDLSDMACPERITERFFLCGEVDRILASLSSRESKVIRLRFGLEDGKVRTLEEIGREFRLTKERIRQIEVNALTKLRTHRLAKPIAAYIEDLFGAWDAGYDELNEVDWETLES